MYVQVEYHHTLQMIIRITYKRAGNGFTLRYTLVKFFCMYVQVEYHHTLQMIMITYENFLLIHTLISTLIICLWYVLVTIKIQFAWVC